MSKKNKFTKWTSGMTLLASAPTLASWANPQQGGKSNSNIQIESKKKDAQAQSNSNVISTNILKGIAYTFGVLLIIPVLVYGGVLVYRKMELESLRSQLEAAKNELENAKQEPSYKNAIAKKRKALEETVEKQKKLVEEQEKIVENGKSELSLTLELRSVIEEIRDHISGRILKNPDGFSNDMKLDEKELEDRKGRLAELKGKIDIILSSPVIEKILFEEKQVEELIKVKENLESCFNKPKPSKYDFKLVLASIEYLYTIRLTPLFNCIEIDQKEIEKQEHILKNRKLGCEANEKELEDFNARPDEFLCEEQNEVPDCKEKCETLEKEVKKMEDNFYNIGFFSSEK